MAKISPEAKSIYAERVKKYRHEIDKILQRENSLKSLIAKEDAGTEYKLLTMAEDRINLAAIFLTLNRISVSLLNTKNENFLNDARKSCYEAIIHLENLVGDEVDRPLTEGDERLASIESYDELKRYALVKKLGFTIDGVKEGFGANSKWRWSFVELEARYAVVTRNLVSLKDMIARLDPREEGYSERQKYIELIRLRLNTSADRYREKYELSTARRDDFNLAIQLLSSLFRVNSALGDAEAATQVKRKIGVWKDKMEADEKKAKA